MAIGVSTSTDVHRHDIQLNHPNSALPMVPPLGTLICDMRTATYNPEAGPMQLTLRMIMMVHPTPYRLHCWCRGCVRYESNTVPLPKRVAVVSKYFILCDIARLRGGSLGLGWLVINI